MYASTSERRHDVHSISCGRDHTLAGAAAKVSAVLTSHGVAHDVKEYPDVGHSFMNKTSNRVLQVMAAAGGFGYDERATADARARIVSFFRKYLG